MIKYISAIFNYQENSRNRSNNALDLVKSIGISSTLLSKEDNERIFDRIHKASGVSHQSNPIAALHSVEFSKKARDSAVSHEHPSSLKHSNSLLVVPVAVVTHRHSSSSSESNELSVAHKELAQSLRDIVSSWHTKEVSC